MTDPARPICLADSDFTNPDPEGGNDFWGVEVFQRNGVEYVAASDRDYGIYIFRYTGR